MATEWSTALFEKQWGWLKGTPDDARATGMDSCVSDEVYERFKRHHMALAFWEEAKAAGLELDPVHVHFHPGEFISAFRRCGWLSTNELAQLIPPRTGGTSWPNAHLRATSYNTNLNKCLRKYGLISPVRLALFLAQVYQETGCLFTITEGGSGKNHDYGSFYGRGLMQLTWAGNYAAYGTFRNFPPNPSTTYAGTGNTADPITATSVHEWAAAVTDKNHVVHHDRRSWAPRYDPSIIAGDLFNACDSAGFFWVSKHYTGTSNINRLIDDGFSTDTVGKANVLVNGGGNGYNERQAYAAYVYRYLSDVTDNSTSENLTFAVYRIDNGTWITQGSASTRVDFTPQRP